ncbi:MAG: deoxyguanosinetriphosphate triphosphohydrolase [Mangrovibacterium sp.]
MMNWNQLISTQRLGASAQTDTDRYNRTQFQRDYDRLIFSSAFRRMQNKTQVFPLPGSIFVHNRLTHSLEVACVGRTLGSLLGQYLVEQGENNTLLHELGAVVSAGCLAHDMGNPPFGHAGEEAISDFFTNGNGKALLGKLKPEQQTDFTRFDGNANAFRLLSHQFEGRRAGGLALTYTTLASIVKYPYESRYANKPKFGFSQSEKQTYLQIASALGIPQKTNNPNQFVRHPLVFLVEAADDICYQVMDIEDAYKLNILSYDTTAELLLNFLSGKQNSSTLQRIKDNFNIVTDPNERIAYLRASVINKLTNECLSAFTHNLEAIMAGDFNTSLIKLASEDSQNAMGKVQEISLKKIYNHRTVVEIEIAGYKILGTLLDVFTHAVFAQKPQSKLTKMQLSMIPEQYLSPQQNDYEKLQSIVDFISGMTDVYALDLYRKIQGINLPGIGI